MPNDLVRLSNNNWESQLNGVMHNSNLDQSDYNHLEVIAGQTPGSALNNTQNLKLSDYLRIIDSKGNGSAPVSSKHKFASSNQRNYIEDSGQYGANITFESLSAIAKLIYPDELKRQNDSEFDFDDDKMNDSNIEEVTEEDISDAFDKRKSQPDFISNQKENFQNNLLLMNALRNVSHKTSYPESKAV